MSEEWICPQCGKPVQNDYVLAREYVFAPDADRRFDPASRLEGPLRRFHATHFTDRVGDNYFALVVEDEAS